MKADAPILRYTTVAIVLHWAIAAAILAQIAGGLWMVNAGDDQIALRFAVYQAHKTIGLIVLALTLVRIAWRLAHKAPPLPIGMPDRDRFAAHGAHVALYALMILVPLTGWLMVSVSPTGVPTLFLMLDSLPFAHLPVGLGLGADEKAAAEALFIRAHWVLAFATIGLFAIHAGAALKHQFFDRDGLILRMLPGAGGGATAAAVRPFAGYVGLGLAAVLIGGGLFFGQPDAPIAGTALDEGPAGETGWVIRPAESALTFDVTFSGQTVTGRFGAWTGDIVFDPETLDAARIEITVDMASASIDNPYLSPELTGPNGFAVAEHAAATFTAVGSIATEEGFQTTGTVTVRGIDAPATVDFTYAETDGVATVSGTALLDRITFGIGASNAPDENWIKHAVTVRFSLVADRL